MRRLRRLSRRERLWVQEAIDQLCAYHRVSDRDEDYRSVAWTAFFGAYRRFYAVSSPDFWPYAYEQISAALAVEKRIRQDWVYRILSLHVPAAPGSGETLLTAGAISPTAFLFGIFSAASPEIRRGWLSI